MKQEKYWIIGVHPVNGVHIQKLELTDQDEDFLDEMDGFEDWDEYVEYMVNEACAELEQGCYSVVAVQDAERLDIIKSLSDE